MSKTSTKISAKDRVQEFGKDKFHCDGDILFCSACNKAVDHVRRQTITDHLTSAKHKTAQKRKAEQSSDLLAKKQCTVTRLFQLQSAAKEQRDAVTRDFLDMMVKANIPLEKADHPAVRQFLSTHVNGGGAIPMANCLRVAHLPSLIDEHDAKLHRRLNQNTFICVIADETTDLQNRPVLNILFQVLLSLDELKGELGDLTTPILVKTVYIEKVNHASVSQALIQCCADFQIDFTKVLLFVSDSASYMVKAWNDILSALWINCHHMHCHAHVIALAGNALRLCLRNVDRCVSLLKSCLVKAPSRRNRFLRHLHSCGVNSPTLPPEPVITRWNTWFNAVIYHAPLLQHYSQFLRIEREQEGDTDVLKELSTLLLSEHLGEHFAFVANNCPRLISTLNVWQSRKPQVHEVYNTMQDLISWLTHLGSSLADETCASAAIAAANKLSEYTKEKKQPCVRFLKAVRALDPSQLPALDVSCYETFKVDLGLPNACDIEWKIYLGLAGDIGESQPSPLSFWKAVQNRVPHLSAHAILLLQFTINSADVERSFSAYNQLFTAQRQRLTAENAAGLLKLYFNHEQ